MSKVCKDHIGQLVNVGDWCAVTQKNEMYVGRVIKATTTVTIAMDSVDEFRKTDKTYLEADTWQEQAKMLKDKFGGNHNRWGNSPDWIRHGKFVKINPTTDMLIKYDVGYVKN